MWFNVSSLGEDEALRQAWLSFMDAYAQSAVRLSPFRAGVPNDFGPVSEALDDRAWCITAESVGRSQSLLIRPELRSVFRW